MMRKYRIYILLLIILLAAGCEKEQMPQPDNRERAEKTVIAYFFGTSLSYYFNYNIADMQTAVARDFLENKRLLLFYSDVFMKPSIKEIYYDKRTHTVCTNTIEEVDFQPLTAEEFASHINRMIDIAPADSYSMILLGHATGWLPKTTDSGETIYSLSPAPVMSKVPGAEITRTVGESRTTLNISELARGLHQTGVKFNALYFDMCFMSSIEAAYELRNETDFVIGSPCEIMGYGSPYNRILQPLFEDDYQSVCYEFWDFYQNEYTGRTSGCIATIETAKLNAVADVVKHINAQPAAEGFNILSVQAYEGNSSYPGKTGHWFYDVEDYFNSICTDRSLTDALTAALDGCVSNRHHTEQYFSAYNNAMNDITHFSGITMTPDEKCIEAIDSQLESSDLSDADRKQLEPQKRMLEYYNASLKCTEWYRATH